MKVEDLKWEKNRSAEIFGLAMLCLKEVKRYGLVDKAEKYHQLALPYLEEARHGNPIHHTAMVLYFCVKIGLSEKLNDYEMEELMAAAAFHDSGFAKIPSTQKKIKKADIDAIRIPRQRDEKRQEAIRLRLSHATMGGEIAWDALNLTTDFSNSAAILPVVNIIKMHDNPSVAELEDRQNLKASYLIHGLSHDYFLAAIHREADRLWMLTADGIKADLAG